MDMQRFSDADTRTPVTDFFAVGLHMIQMEKVTLRDHSLIFASSLGRDVSFESSSRHLQLHLLMVPEERVFFLSNLHWAPPIL